MSWVNVTLNTLLGVLLAPFERLPSLVGLTVVAFVASIGILLVVRATSQPQSILEARRRIEAALFELRLFNDDWRLMLRAIGEILHANGVYLRLAVVPGLWLLIPMALLLVHLQFYYGYEGLKVGAAAVLKVRLDGAAPSLPERELPDISLFVPPGIRVTSPFVWIPSEREVAWNIVPETPGHYEVIVQVDGELLSKQVSASDGLGWRSPHRLRQGVRNEFLAPSEPPINSASPVRSIHIAYPERQLSVLGVRMPWMVPFLLACFAFVFGLKNRLGVVL